MSVKLLGHRVHPMLVGFPIGLLGGSVAFDIAYLATESGRWADVSFWMLTAGIITGLVAAPFGSIDWLSIPKGTRAKRIGLWHGATAVSSVVLFAVSWWLRHEVTLPDAFAIVISFVAIAVLLVAGWLGGELVERLGVGVDSGAHLNSPSSISGRPANETTMPGD